MPNPTPGQVNYHAYCTATYGQHAQVGDYHDLTWGQRAAWEAAAEAVLTAQYLGDGLCHYVTEVETWLTVCGESQRAWMGTDCWSEVTCPACQEYRATHEDPDDA